MLHELVIQTMPTGFVTSIWYKIKQKRRSLWYVIVALLLIKTVDGETNLSINILWKQCLKKLERDLSPQVFNTWIRPLHAHVEHDVLTLLAPNRFVLDWVKRHHGKDIYQHLKAFNHNHEVKVCFDVGTYKRAKQPQTKPVVNTNDKQLSLFESLAQSPKQTEQRVIVAQKKVVKPAAPLVKNAPLNKRFTFQQFVLGESNRLAHAASMEMVNSNEFNPLFIYGGTGLGKTHLMQAVGHAVSHQRPQAKIAYLHSERFVAEMVKALQSKSINRFKDYYRSVDVLLIDDIQFLAGKTQSQEEFFHTFNTLIDGEQQIILTSDRTPKEIQGLDDRLKSRLGSGLTVNIQKPEVETKVNILTNRALQSNIMLPEEVAEYIAENMNNSIRELEGGLHRLLASARLMQEEITLDFSRDALKDLIKPKPRFINVGSIQQTVANYYNISTADLLSKRRHRHIARPRQMAMLLARELTPDSYPSIGRFFGGRDRTTVLHACKTITALRLQDPQINQDYTVLSRLLS